MSGVAVMNAKAVPESGRQETAVLLSTILINTTNIISKPLKLNFTI